MRDYSHSLVQLKFKKKITKFIMSDPYTKEEEKLNNLEQRKKNRSTSVARSFFFHFTVVVQ